jgi:uncharacterized protein YggE
MFSSTSRSRVPVLAVFASVVAASLVLFSLPVGARPSRLRGGADATVNADNRATNRTLVATGTARVRGIPDVLQMQFGVRTRGRTVGEALDRNSKAASRVVAVLFDGGVDKTDLQTSNFSISPSHDPRTGDVTGYEVGNVLTVRLRDMDRVGSLIDQAVEAGGDDVVMHGVTFEFADATALISAARGEAVRRARSQAEELAKAAGVELGEIRKISESSEQAVPLFSVPEAARSQASDVTIEPGTEELTVMVTIVYTLR